MNPLPLLANVELPSAAYVWAVGVLFAGLVFFGGVFAALRSLRANLADELKRELASSTGPTRVDVQSPLVVRPHTEFATRTDAEILKAEIDKIDSERRVSVASLHNKVDNNISALRQELTGKIEKLENRIDAVPERTINLLRETKGLI